MSGIAKENPDGEEDYPDLTMNDLFKQNK
jgi:hypothetical protein